MKPGIKGGLIVEALIIISFLVALYFDGWAIFAIPFVLALMVPAFFVGVLFGNLFSKRVEKSSAYHKKWMIWSGAVAFIVLISWFLYRYFYIYLPRLDSGTGNTYLSNIVFTLGNMSPLLYLTLFTAVGIFVIATILYIVTKIKSK
ncbi:MAG: hypothetical protein WC494_02525 [Candidatus Pacearchaeota archaeon]